jgi:hypothetical protein
MDLNKIFNKNLLVLLLIFLFLTNLENQMICQSRMITNISGYQIPDTMSFCGEKVPLDVQSIRERMEREFFLILDKQGQLLLYIKRSGRYFPIIEKKLSGYRMPTDLKYIAIAESALLNSISDKGATGPWQLMNSTAKGLGLKIDKYIDERFNFDKATEAALRYLNGLYRMFNNWTLSVAAYNVGPLIIKENLEYQWENNYYNLFLNEETSRFIFRILALKIIMSEPKKLGLSISSKDLYKPLLYKTISLIDEIPNIAFWAKSQGTNYYEIKNLNQWILGRSLPKGNYEIRLPINAVPQKIDKDKYQYKEKTTSVKRSKRFRKR